MFNNIPVCNDLEDSVPDSNMGIFLNPEPNPMYVRVCVMCIPNNGSTCIAVKYFWALDAPLLIIAFLFQPKEHSAKTQYSDS